MGNTSYLIAEPWKALADYMRVNKKFYRSLAELKKDLRVEPESFEETNIESFQSIIESYSSRKVCNALKKLHKELVL